MNVEDFELTLEYTSDKKISKNDFFEKDGSLPFDSQCKGEMKLMMQEVATRLHLKDEYSLRKLEIVLRYELPFFTTNRRLVKNWIMENFIY